MIQTTRREALMGVMAVPAVTGLPKWSGPRGEASLLLYDPALMAGRRFAEAGAEPGRDILGIDGDRVRFAAAAFGRRPALVLGISRPADALLIEEVGREAGYRPVDWGSEALRAIIAASRGEDRGLVLGWALAPRR